MFAQLRGEVAAGPASLFAQADGALTFTDRSTFAFSDAVGNQTDVAIDVDNGDLYGVQVGASVPVGPVEVGLAAFVAGRTAGSVSYPDGFPPGLDGFPDPPREQEIQTPYRSAVGLIPSVAYRAPGGRLVARLDGAVSGFALMENTPVGITLAGREGWVTRPALTLSASVSL